MRRKQNYGKNKCTYRGFSLVEIVLAIAIFAIIFSSVAFFAIDSVRAVHSHSQKVRSSLLLQEIYQALILHKNDLWSSIVDNTGNGEKHLLFSGNKYQIADGTIANEEITLGFTIVAVQRDASDNIVESGGSEDPHTRKVTLTASWTDLVGQNRTFTESLYITDWNTLRWVQTTEADFNAGTHNATETANTAGGEVKLDEIVFADWCNPSLTLTAHDLPGQGVAQAITAIQGRAFVGTGTNASGLAFANVTIDPVNPPIVNVAGTFNGHKTNAVFGEANYGYIATDTNAKEVVIIDLTTNPYSEAGYFNAPGNTEGNALYVVNDKGYVAARDKFRVFDLSSKSGSRPEIGTGVTLAGTGKKIIIRDNYAYVAVDSNVTQLQIIDISDPNNLQIVGSAQVTGLQAISVAVSADTTRTYLATKNSNLLNEFFIIDTSGKSGLRSVISAYNTNGMDPRDVTNPAANRAIMVGSGAEEYQVIDLTNENSPSRCGGLQIDTSINAATSITESNSNTYSYLVTGDANNEFKIIKGGPGGGNANGMGYSETGDFVSQVFDTQSTTTRYFLLEWKGQSPNNTTLKLQIRTGTTSDLSSVTWHGPDGTGDSYFTSQQGTTIPNLTQNKRYLQFKVYFTSDTLSTATFEEATITYQQ